MQDAPTLESIKADHARLGDSIAKLEATARQRAIAISCTTIQLMPGEHYAGLLLDGTGWPSHHLILLPGQATDVTWQAAQDWATKAGGELPTRREQSLLFANLKSEFEAAWYWSAESHTDGACAWLQYFDDGDQDDLHESYEGRARAVRRFSA